MTNEHDDMLSGLLAQAVRELLDTPQANERPDELDSIVLRQLPHGSAIPNELVPPPVAPTNGAYSAMPKFIRYALAVSFVIVAGIVGWFGLTGGTNVVYGAVAERLKNLRSVVYRVEWVDEVRLTNLVTGEGDRIVHLVPSQYRIESSDGSVLVIDTEVAKGIRIHPATKTALSMQGDLVNNIATSFHPVLLLETLQKHFRTGEVQPAGVEVLETRHIGGIRAPGFRSSINGEIVEAWIDPATSLPIEVRICLVIPPHMADSGNQAVRMWRVISFFEYDVEVDPSLMRVDIPSGYAVIEMPHLPPDRDTSEPSLEDLITALRLCAQHNDSVFPDSLSTLDDTPGSCLAIMKRFADAQEELLETGTDTEKQAAMKAVMEFGASIGRVTPFLFSLQPKNKLRYFGAGVKMNAPKRPILWFSPKGDTQFQVVYADLSVGTVAESALPKLPEFDKPPREAQAIIWSISPRVMLPQSAITNYEKLQAIREKGDQTKVRFIDLHHMPEFMKNDSPPNPNVDVNSSRYKFLEEFRNLEGLDISHLFLTQSDLEIIGRCQSLKQLSLSGVQIVETPDKEQHFLQGPDLHPLSRLENLEVLDLSQSFFSDGLQHLSALPRLHTLILSSFENVNDASIAQLKELPHLQTLVLHAEYAENPEKCVTEAGLAGLRGLPSLRTLYVEYHGQWTLPIEKLQRLLPGVTVQPGFIEGPSNASVDALKKLGEELHSR